ncbi:MAG TPA: stage 0 sporulation protein [Candidatus Moranbacteria bacterium]|nr:MAG: PSP1 domain protein [Candidatus Moranbacteria bacterium GW2011_GWF1_34_10]HBI16965.1 stage 0 sporulation protein [Candidatus Moranbacteria bacterium]
MFKYLVNLCGWGDPKVCLGSVEFKKGDKIIVEDESGNILGTVKNILNQESERENKSEVFTILREATERDLNNFEKNSKKEKEILDICRKEAKRMELEMKFVDVFTTLGKGTVIITFIADGRVDFRQLVKNLSRIFHRSVRMRQIGSRDEARNLGGCGVCGKELCCVKFLGEIPSISTDMAKIQNVAQRGSDRISGICGRLMCCLSYESEQYKSMLIGMPEVGSKVRIKRGSGEVIELSPLEQTIKLRLDSGEYVIIKKEELK